ncbi:hypothetical protein UlMin_038026 [Ulmus minor]
MLYLCMLLIIYYSDYKMIVFIIVKPRTKYWPTLTLRPLVYDLPHSTWSFVKESKYLVIMVFVYFLYSYLQQCATKDNSFSYEVLDLVVVDDGSSNGTKRVAFDFMRKYSVDNVRVILLGRNHGKGEAIRKGMLHLRGELLLMLDTDEATKIHVITRKEFNLGDSVISDSIVKLSDIPIVAFGSHAHLEKKALASVQSFYFAHCLNILYKNFLFPIDYYTMLCHKKMVKRQKKKKIIPNWPMNFTVLYLCFL